MPSFSTLSIIIRQVPAKAVMSLLCCASVLFIFSCYHVAAADLDEQRGSLRQVKKQITSTTCQLQKKQAAEKSALQRLEKVDSQISQNNAALRAAANSIKQSRKEITELKEKIARYRIILDRSQKDVEKRLRALYTSGDMSTLRLIFSTATPLELAENMNFLGRISAHDKELLDSYRNRMAQFNTAQQKWNDKIAQQKALLQKQKDKKQQLVKNKQQRKSLVKQIHRDTTALHGLLKELEDRSVRMTNLVKKLETKRHSAYVPQGQSFVLAKGKIPWPSSGAVRCEFGTKKDKTFGAQHKNNGLTIAAVPGTSIKAIWAGRIAFAAQFKGYGNLIIIDHGNKYYSLYAQAAYLDHPIGTIVKQGDVITTSGFEGRDSYYLEIRHGSTPLNPRHWLQPRQW